MFLLSSAFCVVCLMAPEGLRADTISGTIQDPSGAVIAGARIEITSDNLAQPVVLISDGLGKFSSPELKPASYSVRVLREGFEPLVKVVDLLGSIQLQLTLAIAREQVSVNVPGKNSALANSDPVYRRLRDVGLGETFSVDNFTLSWEAATFQFQKGTLTVLGPLDGVMTGA